MGDLLEAVGSIDEIHHDINMLTCLIQPRFMGCAYLVHAPDSTADA